MSGSPSAADVRRVGLASLMGTTIEYYDFFVYGTAAALVFGQVFFPNSNPLTATLLSLATFGVAFVARRLVESFSAISGIVWAARPLW